MSSTEKNKCQLHIYDQIKYIVVDVDGTLTDGSIYYDDNGNEIKKFSTKDGTGFNLAHEAGMKIIVITGRECPATLRRMKELRVEYIFQGVKLKEQFLSKFMKNKGIEKDEVCYIGDDINDIPGMKLCGFVGCPADGSRDVKIIADYVSEVNGGHGAMRDVVEYILEQRGIREEIVRRTYESGV